MSLADIVALLPDYGTWAWNDYLFHAFWGFIGGLLRLSASNAPIKPPKRNDRGEIRLGAIGEVVTAMVVGMLTNTNPLASVAAGYASPILLELTLNPQIIRAAIRRWLGIHNNEIP